MGNIDEELQFGFIDLFGMDVLHHLLFGAVAVAHLADKVIDRCQYQQAVCQFRPSGCPPGGRDGYGDFFDVRIKCIVQGFYAEAIGAGGQVAE